MRPGARLQASIDVLTEIAERHRPAGEALADWGRSHRFAGSGDRAAIGNLVYDAMRQRASAAWRMGDDGPRGLALGALVASWGLDAATLQSWCDGSRHAAAPLTAAELGRIEAPPETEPPDWVRGDYPEWLHEAFTQAFGPQAPQEGAALARRAPVDLRVNTLKADREKVLKALKRVSPEPTPWAPTGIRIAPPAGPGKSPHLEAEAGHGKGWFEVQDEGSQIAALMTGAGPRRQVADLCAGAGGKTLALAARMENTGQIHAHDADRMRLRPIFDRLRRAGVRNAQVLPPGETGALDALAGRMDVVVIDAPCSGSGVWRRRPDAKWRLRPQNIETRNAEQRRVLDLGAPLVRPGGRLVYITCSVLPQENGAQVSSFQERHPDFELLPYREAWAEAMATEPPASADGADDTLLLTPARHGTDGFFIAVLVRSDGA